jgi:hypothetical protein
VKKARLGHRLDAAERKHVKYHKKKVQKIKNLHIMTLPEALDNTCQIASCSQVAQPPMAAIL